MRELPIPFNAPMVRAILEGRKTVTRRIVKSIPWRPGVNPKFSQARAFSNGGEFRIAGGAEMTTGFRCPYGKPGDRLYVRETVRVLENLTHGRARTLYEADQTNATIYGLDRLKPIANGRCVPNGCHRQGARIWLEVTDVRVERLRDISDAQAAREGLIQLPASGRFVANAGEQYFGGASRDPREVFSWLWNDLAKPGTHWADNPWVWVVEFRRVEVR